MGQIISSSSCYDVVFVVQITFRLNKTKTFDHCTQYEFFEECTIKYLRLTILKTVVQTVVQCAFTHEEYNLSLLYEHMFAVYFHGRGPLDIGTMGIFFFY